MPDLPSSELVRELPEMFAQSVPVEFIDQNGHMNITHYFQLGAWAPWRRLVELGMAEDYIETRGLSFFTVEHRIRYVGELRVGERFSVRPTLVGRTDMALHAVSYVLAEERDVVVCSLEVVYVHVSMDSRRAAPIPDDLAASLDAELARHRWASEVATGLALRR